jgi:hypothetical protein
MRGCPRCQQKPDVYDDGVSFDYRRGKRACLRVTAQVDGATMRVTTNYLRF